jgi:hypothetical protein
MSLKTLIVLCIFAGLIVTYLVYMAGEMSKSNKKIEAFQEAADAHRAAKAKMNKGKAKERFEEEAEGGAAADTEDEETTTPPPRKAENPSRVLVTSSPARSLATAAPSGTRSPAATATQAGTRSPVGTFGPTTTSSPSSTAATTSSPSGTSPPIGTLGPAATSSAPSTRKDFEKSLFIVNKYEEIFGTKIGPEELEQLTTAFANIDDKEVIAYKMKEMKYKGVDEIDTIFQLADVSDRLSNIVGKLKARAGALQNAPNMCPTAPGSAPTTFPPTMAAFATTLPPVSTTRAPLEAFSNNRKFMPY